MLFYDTHFITLLATGKNEINNRIVKLKMSMPLTETQSVQRYPDDFMVHLGGITPC